jgi:hypothetical protein
MASGRVKEDGGKRGHPTHRHRKRPTGVKTRAVSNHASGQLEGEHGKVEDGYREFRAWATKSHSGL